MGKTSGETSQLNAAAKRESSAGFKSVFPRGELNPPRKSWRSRGRPVELFRNHSSSSPLTGFLFSVFPVSAFPPPHAFCILRAAGEWPSPATARCERKKTHDNPDLSLQCCPPQRPRTGALRRRVAVPKAIGPGAPGAPGAPCQSWHGNTFPSSTTSRVQRLCSTAVYPADRRIRVDSNKMLPWLGEQAFAARQCFGCGV